MGLFAHHLGMNQVRRLENDDRPVFKVLAERAGAIWFISVPDVPGALASVRRREYVESIARAAIARVVDLPEDGFDVEISEVEDASRRGPRETDARG